LWIARQQTLDLLAAIPSLAPFVAITAYCWWAGHRRVRDVLLVLTWCVLFVLFASALIEAAARAPFVLVDDALGRIDHGMTAVIVNWLNWHYGLRTLSSLVYASLFPFAGITIVLPAALGYSKSAYRVILAVAIGTLITVAVFTVLPAAGPWTVEHYQPTKMQAFVTRELHDLKAGTAAASMDSQAIVSFPSFHCVLAILCACAWWPVRRARYTAAALATAICISTVTTGWHYGIDVIGGSLVALGSQWAARRVV